MVVNWVKKETWMTTETLADLQRQVEEYELIFASMPIMLWYKDDKNRHIRVNAAAAALEGLKPEDVEGKTAYELYPKEQADAFYADDLDVLKSGRPKLNIIEKHVTPTGETFWMQTGKVPLRDKNGKNIGIVVFAADITQQKQAELSLQQSYTALEKKNQQLRRVQEFIRSTLGHIEEVTKHGADRAEIVGYCRSALDDLDKLDQRS